MRIALSWLWSGDPVAERSIHGPRRHLVPLFQCPMMTIADIAGTVADSIQGKRTLPGWSWALLSFHAILLRIIERETEGISKGSQRPLGGICLGSL
jgi:hypothetical protein